MDEDILTALNEHFILKFSYEGKRRTCEPHVFGVANGKKQVLCYQLSGGSQRGGIPEWRRFELAGITKLKVTQATFPGKRQVPHPHSLGWKSIIGVVA